MLSSLLLVPCIKTTRKVCNGLRAAHRELLMHCLPKGAISPLHYDDNMSILTQVPSM